MEQRAILPEALTRMIVEAADADTARFPQTEIFNEGWMLRLVLDAFKRLEIRDHPLSFLDGADWFSEVRLRSRFRPQRRGDRLAEGFTNADAVVGHFNFRADTRAGLSLPKGCKQFVVVEAKMFSNLSAGVKNAPGFNQAARNVACMAEAIEHGRLALHDIERIGFFVLAPTYQLRAHRQTNLETSVQPEAVRAAVAKRIRSYEEDPVADATELHTWLETSFEPLLARMEREGGLQVLAWDELIQIIQSADHATGATLWDFYQRCLELNRGPSLEDKA